MSKTFEKASRMDAYGLDPFDICIVGGKALPEDEQGPRDTEWDPSHPLHQDDLKKPLTEDEIENVVEMGVLVPIEVVKLGNVPTVVFGRGRVRKARVAALRRKARGMPALIIKATVVREANSVELLKRMISENLFRKEVGVLDRINLAKIMLARGSSEEEAARICRVTKQQFKNWLQLEDNATEKTRAALSAGRLSPSAAIELASITDPDEQDKALMSLLGPASNGHGGHKKPTARAAQKVARKAKGKAEVVTVGKRQIKAMSKIIEPLTKGNERYQGIMEAIRWMLGENPDGRLAKLLEKAASKEA